MKNQSESKPGPIYNFFFTASIVVNIVLALFSGYSAFKTSGLQDEKSKIEIEKNKIEHARLHLEQELFVEKNTPHLSTFYLITKIESLYAFLKSKESFPYAQQVDRYRMLENKQLQQLSLDMEKLRNSKRIEGTVHFLVIVNSGEINAYNIKLINSNRDSVEIGNIELHSALLIPIYYGKSNYVETKISPLYTSLKYYSKADGLQQQFVENIKAPVNPSWVPTLGDLRGWGRATIKNDNTYLKDLIPEQKK